MGNIYYGPNSDCYHCNGCGTHRACDDCSASCCQNNMASHRELRSYEESFGSAVNNLCRSTLDDCLSIIDNLRKNYNIVIEHNIYDNNYLNQSKEIINKMEEKNQNLIKEASSIKVDDSLKKRMKQLKSQHKIKMKEIKEDFNKKDKNKEDPELNELNKEIKEKDEEKNKLKEEKKKIEDNQQIEINNFKNQQIEKLNNEFSEKKKIIDTKYNEFEYNRNPVKEYSLEEKEEKKNLLENIRQIENYKNEINGMPKCNYESFIQFLKIANYLEF